MSLRKSIVLACLLAILSALVFKVVVPGEQAKELAGYALEGLGEKAIERIELINSSGTFTLENKKVDLSDRLALDREESTLAQDRTADWSLQGVEVGGLDRAQLNSLIDGVVKLKLDNKIPEEETEADKALYGLANPLAELRVYSGSKRVDLKFGKKNEYLSKRYVEIGSKGSLHLVPEALFELASKKSIDFRNRNPFEVNEAEVKRLVIDKSAERVALERDETGTWSIVEPARFSASAEKVSALFRDLRSIRVSEFVEDGVEKLEQYGLNAPAGIFSAFLKDESKPPFVLKFGARQDAGAADTARDLQRDGERTVYRVEARDPFGLLVKSVNDLRERRLLRFPVDAVSKVIYEEQGAQTITVEKKGDEWTVNGAPGDAPFIREALQRLAELQADDFPNEGRDFGFAKPRVRIGVELSSSEGSITQRTLVIGALSDTKQDKKRYFAAVDEFKEPFVVEEKTFRQVIPKYEALIKTAEAPPPPAANEPPSE